MGDADPRSVARLEERLRALEELVAQQAAIIAAQAKRIADLEAKLAKSKRDSSNSSKPPSSDIVKPPKPAPPEGQTRRKIGGQPGHPRHERTSFPPERVDRIRTYTLERCPETNGRLKRSRLPPRIVQQVGLAPKPFIVTEHRALAYWCERCRAVHYAAFPNGVEEGGLFDAEMTALTAFLKGPCHASYSTVKMFFGDHLGLAVSRGQLAKTVAKVSDALAGPHEELAARLPREPHVNVDETGHKDPERTRPAGKRPLKRRALPWWVWTFQTELFTLFRIIESRGSNVLIETLGRAFAGVLGSDCFPAYLKYMEECSVLLQLCLAHLIREVKFLAEHPDPAVRSYGTRFLDSLKALFDVIHRRDQMTARGFRRSLRAAKRQVLAAGTRRVPAHLDAQLLAKRMREHGEAYFTFMTTPGVEPTNNLAERAIRFVVIDRRITQGTRGARGRRWCERIWTAVATCAQQGRSVYRYLVAAVRAHFAGRPAPSLLPNPP